MGYEVRKQVMKELCVPCDKVQTCIFECDKFWEQMDIVGHNQGPTEVR